MSAERNSPHVERRRLAKVEVAPGAPLLQGSRRVGGGSGGRGRSASEGEDAGAAVCGAESTGAAELEATCWDTEEGGGIKDLSSSQLAVRKRGGRGQSHAPGAALEEAAAASNTGGVKVCCCCCCCPKTGAGLLPAPKAGAAEGVAVKGEPNDEPNEGV